MQRFLVCVATFVLAVFSASAQEFGWVVPAELDVELQQNVQNGNFRMAFRRNGNVVAFSRLSHYEWGDKSEERSLGTNDSGVYWAKHVIYPKWDEVKKKDVGGEIDEVNRGNRFTPPHYYRRPYDTASWDGVEPLEKWLKRVAIVFSLDQPVVSGKLVQRVDELVSMFEASRRKGGFQKEFADLFLGFAGLYKDFRAEILPSAVLTEDEPEEPRAVEARGKMALEWATLKKR